MKNRVIDPAYLKSTLDIKDFLSIKELFKESEPVDIADALSELNVMDCIVLFRLVHKKRKVEIFSYLAPERQIDLIEDLPGVLVTSLLNEMEPDDRTHLLEGLEEELKTRLLLRLSPEERNVAWKLLSYPEDSVGRLMTPDFMIIKETMKAGQSLEYIRWSSELPAEFLNYLFIVDESGRLTGEITLAELVKADPPSQIVKDIMSANYISLEPNTNQEEALEIFKKYDRLIVPVVDQDRKMIGLVSADDMFDVAEEEATEDIQQFGGQGALEHSYFQTPLHIMIQKRAGWLCLLFFGMLFSGSILRHYGEAVEQLAYLVIFLPMVISAGGNSGTQSASLIIRGIALSEMDESHWKRVFKREIVIGLALGILLATLGYLRASFWGYSAKICFVVSITLLGVVIFGALSGALLPFFFKKMKLDPAVVSSPFITTIVDLSGIVIFINVARLIAGI
jgi:magnesium transporter